MNEIICPNCTKAFKVDEAGFADILKQVKDEQFEKELQNRLRLADKEKEAAVKLMEANIKNLFQEQIAIKDKELATLKASSDLLLSNKINEKETKILQLEAKIAAVEV